jgi:hypothetical protein
MLNIEFGRNPFVGLAGIGKNVTRNGRTDGRTHARKRKEKFPAFARELKTRIRKNKIKNTHFIGLCSVQRLFDKKLQVIMLSWHTVNTVMHVCIGYIC